MAISHNGLYGFGTMEERERTSNAVRAYPWSAPRHLPGQASGKIRETRKERYPKAKETWQIHHQSGLESAKLSEALLTHAANTGGLSRACVA